MAILALLPILCVCENLGYSRVPTHAGVFPVQSPDRRQVLPHR